MLHHLDDVASDMSVFHRVNDIGELDGPTLFKLAWRLPAYSGVVRAALLTDQGEQPAPAPGVGEPAVPRSSPDSHWNPGTRATLMADPELKGLFSFGSFASDG